MKLLHLFDILSDDENVASIGDVLFVDQNMRFDLEILDNGRVYVTASRYDGYEKTRMATMTLHSKGYMKKEMTETMKKAWLSIPRCDEAFLSSLTSSNAAEMFDNLTQTRDQYERWMNNHIEHPWIWSVGFQKKENIWKIYVNDHADHAIVTVFHKEGRCHAHPCQRSWVLVANLLNERLAHVCPWTDAMIEQNVRAICKQIRSKKMPT